MLPIDVALAGKSNRSARFYINAVEDGAGEGESAVINAIDITEQRGLEQQFAQSQKMETVGKLAGGIAHDFNNVLTAIIGFSDLLLSSHRPSDPSFQDIMNIKQNANRAAGLVRQLLAFSRRQTLRPQVLVLSDLLSDLSILLTRLLGENVKLQLVHGRDLWPIKADINQFEQVIVNLAVNGRDAMPGGGTMSIRTRNVSAAEMTTLPYQPLPAIDSVLIEVEDTGTGMPPEVQERIFEPFFSTKEVGKGTGLGLSTVYGIVKQTGAYIFFDSVVGKGTVFRIFIPRHVPAEGEKVASHAEPEPQIADLTGTATILLVEDEEAVQGVCGAGADLARLQGLPGRFRGGGAGSDERGGRPDRSRRLRRGHARTRRSVAVARTEKDPPRAEDHLHFRLCRGSLQEEPPGGRGLPFPAEALLAEAAWRSP